VRCSDHLIYLPQSRKKALLSIPFTITMAAFLSNLPNAIEDAAKSYS